MISGVGFGEWLVLLAVVLVVVGPKRLPEACRKLGTWYGKFRRMSENLRRELMEMDRRADRATAFVIDGEEASAIPDTRRAE